MKLVVSVWLENSDSARSLDYELEYEVRYIPRRGDEVVVGVSPEDFPWLTHHTEATRLTGTVGVVSYDLVLPDRVWIALSDVYFSGFCGPCRDLAIDDGWPAK